jgi:hypothetical protein
MSRRSILFILLILLLVIDLEIGIRLLPRWPHSAMNTSEGSQLVSVPFTFIDAGALLLLVTSHLGLLIGFQKTKRK